MPGTLYVVATPIGNLEDITLRALRVLREVDLIACEDTRHTAKLLTHFGIHKRTTSYHDHNEARKAAVLVDHLEAGQNVALVTDAGTPCLSDPGYTVVHLAREKGISVIPIPGPCSFIAALSVSGQSSDEFTFLGFLPSRKGARAKFLDSLKSELRTLIFLESPERILETLADLSEILGDRPLTVARELTKVHEEFFSGTPREALEFYRTKPPKGEIVLIVGAGTRRVGTLVELSPTELRARVGQFVEQLGLSKMEAIKHLARELHVPRRALYKNLLDSEKGEAP